MAEQSKIDPARTALILMDFQPTVLAGLGAAADAPLCNAERALGWARASGVRVAHVRLAFRGEDLDAIPDRNKSFRSLKGSNRFVDGTAECDFAESLQPASGDMVVRKTRIGWFSTTDLDKQLRLAGVDTLILAGIRTSGVLLSTVREAADQDFALYVLKDACADGDPLVHEMLTEKVFPHQSEVITTAEVETLV